MEEESVEKPKSPEDAIQRSINHFAGETIRNKVFEGKTLEELSALSEMELAKWVKGAMDRLDALVDERTRIRIMDECGRMCAGVNRSVIEEAIAKRRKYKSIDEFLEAEARALWIVREGDVLYLTYTPQKSTPPVRCYCLGKGLPAEETISPTYCQCSVGFVKKYWEDVLERPAKVELIHSAITGGQDCRFAIHL